MNQLHYQGCKEATNELWALANGPHRSSTRCYSGYIVNEVRFHIKDRDNLRITQNNGLLVEEEHEGKMVEFFDFLKRVVQLAFLKKNTVMLFECEWFNTESCRIV